MLRAVRTAIKKAFPKAKIVNVEAETHILLIYEVELDQDGQEFEAEVFVNGEILSVEREITREDLPKAIAAALDEVAGDADVKEIEKKQT